MTEQTDQNEERETPPDAEDGAAPGRSRRRLRPGRSFLLVFCGLVLLVGLGLALLVTTRGEMRLPDWAVAKIERKLSAGLAPGAVEMGEVKVILGDGIAPGIRLTDLALLDRAGDPARHARAILPEMLAEFDLPALLRGTFRPRRILLDGAEMQLSRAADGTIDVAFGAFGSGTALSLQDMVRTVEQVIDGEPLRRLERIEATGMSVRLDDALTARVWNFTEGRLTLVREGGRLEATLGLSLDRGPDLPATAQLSLTHRKGAPETRVQIALSNVHSRDLAAQSAVLSWLEVLDAPISGALATEVTAAGRFAALHGTLTIGPGALDVVKGTDPARFERAKAYFRFEDEAEKLVFDQVVVDSPSAAITAEGHAYLVGRSGREVEALLGQFRFTRFAANPPGVFAEPAVFETGALDLRLRPSPFAVDIGQMVLVEGDTRLSATGRVAVTGTGLEAALDAEVTELDRDRLLALWPVALKPKTRKWLTENVEAVTFRDARVAVRQAAGQPPRLQLNFDFEGLATRYMRAMPLLRDGRGYGVMTEQRLDLKLYEGSVTPPAGGALSLAGTTFSIPDIRIKNGPVDIALRTAGSLRATLEILDHEPLGFMTKGRVPTDIATGRAETQATLRFPLIRKLKLRDVDWTATGRILGARSDRLLGEKPLTAPDLAVRADPDGVVISGTGSLGSLPAEGSFEQRFGREHAGKARVEVQLPLSQAFLDEFGIALPKNAVGGTAAASLGIDLTRGEPPAFRLVSDLNRMALRLDALGWAKPAASVGRLVVEGLLTRPARVDRLELEAAGLDAAGRIELTEDGGLGVAAFDRVRIGDWLDARVELRGRPGGAPVGISVLGGQLDMRRADFGGAAPGGGASGGGSVALALDRLIVTDTIALTDIDGGLNTKGLLNGRFAARVNGAAPVTVTLGPSTHGTGIRMVSRDAGAVLHASGLFSGARGGDLVLQMVPTGQPESYMGRVDIRETRVRDAPTLAELLSAVSVIGLLEQLSGAGIHFDEASADLHLSPRALTVRKGAAVGPSMGISMEGVYDLGRKRLNMQGVVTPIYLLNGMLEKTGLFGGLFGRGKGEGVFGFTYRLQGPPNDPQVRVNPLSALAPGVFRELFRRDPPAMPTQ